MKEYKQWHDENNNFFSEFKIMFGQCNLKHELSLTEILRILSDTAVEDYAQRGMTWQFLDEREVAILLSRASYHFIRRPLSNEEVMIRTWEETPEGLQLTRAYEILDKDHNLLVTGRSTWLVVNPKTRRIMKPSQFDLREAPTRKEPYEGLPCGKIPVPENMEHIDTRPVRFSDLDGNGHVNNSRYGAYTVDALPEELLQRPIKDMKINYSKEAVPGNVIEIYALVSEDKSKITVVGKQDNNTCYECELYF